MPTASVPWREAWARAQLGPDGFYRRADGTPSRHFATSAGYADVLAAPLVELLARTDRALGHPPRLDLVDVGAGDGSLLAALLARLDRHAPVLTGRVIATAVDVRQRPPDLDPRVRWVRGAAPPAVHAAFPDGVRGLLLALELLDDIPCDVVEVDPDGRLRTVLVDPRTGDESYGEPPSDADRAWLDRWWPLSSPADRAEVGRTRDLALRGLVDAVSAGTVLVVDYAHRREERIGTTAGTLTGYRDGHRVPPVPDGGCNVTAHVALDACAAALEGGCGRSVRTAVTAQRAALQGLGLDAALPTPAVARSDPTAYAAGLARASRAGRLLDPDGLGAHLWLVAEVRGHAPGAPDASVRN